MTKECAMYLNETRGRWNKNSSDRAIRKLRQMQAKSYVFTVTDGEADKPIVYAEMTSDIAANDQENAQKLINDWAVKQDGVDPKDYRKLDAELEDLAYNMRKNGYAWFGQRFCFELTPLVG